MGFRSSRHRKVARIKRYSAEERTRMKRELIAEQERARKASEAENPLRGIIGFLSFLKSRNDKGEQDEDEEAQLG